MPYEEKSLESPKNRLRIDSHFFASFSMLLSVNWLILRTKKDPDPEIGVS